MKLTSSLPVSDRETRATIKSLGATFILNIKCSVFVFFLNFKKRQIICKYVTNGQKFNKDVIERGAACRVFFALEEARSWKVSGFLLASYLLLLLSLKASSCAEASILVVPNVTFIWPHASLFHPVILKPFIHFHQQR